MESQSFGQLHDGRSARIFTLQNSSGLQARITNYGGILTHLFVPDRHGVRDDIVLGFNNLESYLGEHPAFGALIGRVAGRISSASFELEGKRYQLAANNPPNHLHGGAIGFDKRLWDAKIEGSSLVLSYLSPSGEEGYPGNLETSVRYTLNEQNELVIEYSAETDQAPPVSLTNHSYFNLNGEASGDMLDHEVQIFSDSYVGCDENHTLTGKVQSVEDSAEDFRNPIQLADRIDGIFKQHGANYMLETIDGGPKIAARIHSKKTGRILEAITDQTCLQFYCANHLDGSLVGKSKVPYQAYAGLCLECQGYPDSPNAPHLPSTILQPGETYRQTTIYKFSTDAEK